MQTPNKKSIAWKEEEDLRDHCITFHHFYAITSSKNEEQLNSMILFFISRFINHRFLHNHHSYNVFKKILYIGLFCVRFSLHQVSNFFMFIVFMLLKSNFSNSLQVETLIRNMGSFYMTLHLIVKFYLTEFSFIKMIKNGCRSETLAWAFFFNK